MHSINYSQQSDPCQNPQFRRRWTEPAGARRMARAHVVRADVAAPERPEGEATCYATLLQWRDDWRRARRLEVAS